MKHWDSSLRSFPSKRGLDLLVAAVLLVLLSPVFLISALVVRLTLGSPVVFKQVRPGLNGKPFTMLKFRTMKDLCDVDGRLLSDEQRLTSAGRFLRKTSIDELPELLNVLKGEMSLVGPRPLLMEYLERYTPEQARRHDVKPGITGLAQVKGRNALLFSQRIKYDLEYVDQQSLFLDLKIIFLTIVKVLFMRLEDGAGQDVSAVDDIKLHPQSEKATEGQEA